MFRNKRKLPLWLILGMVSLVVLTACTAALGGSAVVADMRPSCSAFPGRLFRPRAGTQPFLGWLRAAPDPRSPQGG